MKTLFTAIALLCTLPAWCQLEHLESVQPPGAFDNIYSQQVFSDSLSSSFLLFIKKGVKLHKHAHHSEQVYVMAGEADMILGKETLHIKSGDMILIPKGTPHSVKVTPGSLLKVLSIQSPFFDGTDRIILE